MRVCLCLGLICLPAFAQSFEVADVHTSPRSTPPVVRGPFYTTGRYEVRLATMLDLIRLAYDVDPEKVTGGPSWLEMDRFDVFAKVPPASTAESRRKMLQSLLTERFGLEFHNGNKPIAAFGLTVPKRAQMKESDGEGETGCKFTVENAPTAPPAPGSPIKLPVIVYTCKNTTMASFAGGMLSIPGAGQYFNNRLVVDQTGLKGGWDFTLRFTPKVPPSIPTTGENIPIFDALEKQLGLKLESVTVPMPVIVVDRVNRTPTPNSPESMKSFPPLPTEFEVASVKPTPPHESTENRPPDIKNGRLALSGITLKNLIQVAWEINGDEFLAGAPKWLDEDRYDILAKAPAGVAMGELLPQRNGVSVNIDALRPMLRALIVERFQLEYHMEKRPLNAYTLVAKTPKLKKADPASRTRWQDGALPDGKPGKNTNAALGRLVTCQNVTMAQLAEMLPGIAPGYIGTDVVDATGLEGGWDFTFSFSPKGALQFRRAASDTEASEPNGAISLFDALTSQLGLKLETQKRPMPVLVIDHIERKAIEN
jgi:uncharacterized protein (TIGR03435 family)